MAALAVGGGSLAWRLIESLDRKLPWWPPDVFAVAATVLDEFDGMASTTLAGHERGDHRGWRDHVARVAARWSGFVEASAAGALEAAAWGEVVGWTSEPRWPSLDSAWSSLLTFLDALAAGEDGPMVGGPLDAAHLLLAISDEASRSLCTGEAPKSYLRMAGRLEGQAHESIATFPSRLARVLPKHHTPETGFTLRSICQYLALIPSGGVGVRWMPRVLKDDPVSGQMVSGWSVLIVPWPFEVPRSWFEPEERSATHGVFRLRRGEVDSAPDPVEVIVEILRSARAASRRIDMLVLPELALTTEEADRLLDRPEIEGIWLVTGVQVGPGAPWLGDVAGPANVALVHRGQDPQRFIQAKHHRWRLDQSQVAMYGLHGALDLSRSWWEDIRILPRSLQVIQAQPNLSFSVMICEDLARQEPVAELLRAVGPNLVIALLMDGPQIPGRWGSRYATVLAEDPGSSVLVLTSLGMSRLTREHARSQGWRDEHTTVALWRDPVGGERKISLEGDEVGAVLHLRMVSREETSADGRTKIGYASSPTLAGWTAVRRRATD